MNYRNISFLLLAILTATACNEHQGYHPCLYVTPDSRESVQNKINNDTWAKTSWDNLVESIEPYVVRHVNDPDWIISRLAMYWEEGKRYTQCYLKKQNWDYGEGNAPVPTVRLPGMRVWNDYRNVSLEERIPYNKSGDMLGLSRSNPDSKTVLVPYKESGHMIRGNNTEILQLAEKAAFVYWITQDEKYARFSSDIFQAWLLGTYYMNPPLDPEKSTGGLGGYEPGGIIGYYDYEQIHDDLQVYAASTYDFLFDYLNSNPDEHLEEIGKNIAEVAGEVFKRFIEIGLVRGGKYGNWNVNGFEMILRSMLVLEPNSYYADGKGREYYLEYFTNKTTDYHEALPDILKMYDQTTGLWPESPGYATGTISSLLNMAMPIYKSGVDIIAQNPVMQKAALANLAWIDARGNLVNFGDGRGGHLKYDCFERLYSYYNWKNDEKNAVKMVAVLQKGIAAGHYSRLNSDWVGICLNEKLPDEHYELPYYQTAWSATHRHLIMKNQNNIDDGMMFTLYGGTKGKHLSENGLAMQFYGKGWALAPDASAYVSYWSDNYKYHQSATGSNTILPGYTEGVTTVNAIDPAPGGFTNSYVTFENCSFADMSANEKRRVVAMIRTSDTTGYYVDIFRSDLKDNDYLHHNLGNSVKMTNTSGQEMQLNSTNDLGTKYSDAYSYFTHQRKISYSDDYQVIWTIDSIRPVLHTEMWMMGQDGRELYILDAPPTTLLDGVTPAGVNKSPEITPTLIVRQNANNAQKHPFVAVFEVYEENKKSVQDISDFSSSGNFVGLKVESQTERRIKQFILSATDGQNYSLADGIGFQGTFGVISESKEGLQYLYLGKGKMIRQGKCILEAVKGEVSACLEKRDGKYFYSSDSPVKIGTMSGNKKEYPAGYNLSIY